MWNQNPPTSELSRVRRSPSPRVRETQHVPSLTSFSNTNVTKSWEEQQERLAISNQYSIVPAYNKGPYMVVPTSELTTAGRKV